MENVSRSFEEQSVLQGSDSGATTGRLPTNSPDCPDAPQPRDKRNSDHIVGWEILPFFVFHLSPQIFQKSWALPNLQVENCGAHHLSNGNGFLISPPTWKSVFLMLHVGSICALSTDGSNILLIFSLAVCRILACPGVLVACWCHILERKKYLVVTGSK